MARKPAPELTSAQKKVLKDAAAGLDQAYAAARKAISAAGIKRSGNDSGSTKCLQSPTGHCKSFVHSARVPGIRCTRFGCGHSFFKHDVF